MLVGEELDPDWEWVWEGGDMVVVVWDDGCGGVWWVVDMARCRDEVDDCCVLGG